MRYSNTWRVGVDWCSPQPAQLTCTRPSSNVRPKAPSCISVCSLIFGIVYNLLLIHLSHTRPCVEGESHAFWYPYLHNIQDSSALLTRDTLILTCLRDTHTHTLVFVGLLLNGLCSEHRWLEMYIWLEICRCRKAFYCYIYVHFIL